MGAVAEEELRKCEKMQGAREEKILVLVRLRPLSEKEIEGNEVADWECINESTILYRNTLREGSTFPSAYTFDRVFRGDGTTKQVYEEGARDIALSVISGINSSIFAYGQTSSGKTYTMTGITQYAVADIFDYIKRHEERTFVLKFSAIEIYNEAVRDLLSTDNTPLRLRDDPERGPIVERITEEALRDWNHFEELLSVAEAQRRVGETLLNEKSSRSHQIIRLTIESSAREFIGKDSSTTLSASVNFVDLAGSERASQALSAGARLKEGCHINRSLLTLGTVVRKLSKGKQGHINYRDSKLTRILQPCLGGNARTAIICTLSPARSHVEQTRNTLLFACCAKEVTTKARVNVVMSDKALVKHLQKELARLESELRSPVPISSTCDYAALLRKKDLQIAKMEKEIRELTKQRDLAQSRVEDLLRIVGHSDDSRLAKDRSCNKWRRQQAWEDDISETSSISDPHILDTALRKLNNSQSYNGNSETTAEEIYSQLQANTMGNPVSREGYSPLCNRMKSVKQGETSISTTEDSDDCKEVRCIERNGSGWDDNSELHESEGMSALTVPGNGNAAGQETTSTRSNGNGGAAPIQNGFTNSTLEQRLQDVQTAIGSLVSPYPDDPLQPIASDITGSRSLKLNRSRSCTENMMTGSSSPEKAESTPPHYLERGFPGRPEGFQRKFHPLNYGAALSRLDSQSSMGSALSIRASGDEDITSLGTFVSGLNKMAKLECGKQPFDGEDKAELAVMDPEQGALESAPNWPQQFERQQRMILELWESCNVSLVHRTYFFLLFRGDPADSIYMEVELRRLTFLKETSSTRNGAMENGHTLTPASGGKALRREREKLSRLMQKRFSEEERNALFKRWGIALNSKRRRLQLANCLWSNSNDMNHIIESAAIVAKLVRFVEQGQALKGMFGLSFTPPSAKRQSFGWKTSIVSVYSSF